MLETVAGSASHDPAIPRLWMLVDDETMVRGILVLTNSRLQQRSSLQQRKAKLQIATRRLHTLRRGHSIAVRWIKTWSTGIVSQLEPTPLASGNAIEELLSVVDPNGQLLFEEPGVAGWRAKEIDFLPGRLHSIADQCWEKASKPWTARKNIAVRSEVARSRRGTRSFPTRSPTRLSTARRP